MAFDVVFCKYFLCIGLCFAKKNGLLKKIPLSLFMVLSSLLGILVTIHTLLWFSKLSYLHPNTNTLLSGPQVFSMEHILLEKHTRIILSHWLIRSTQLFSLLGILTSLWELSPFGLQDNTAQICLFLPFHIVFFWHIHTKQQNRF